MASDAAADQSALQVAFYQAYCRQLADLNLVAGQQLVVALGGGADSQTVLDLTLRYRREHPQFDYLAIHLDHHFHPDSPNWAAFLRDYCQANDMPVIVESLAVTQASRTSKEAAGRQARYQRLCELTTNNACILLGQHLSDQTETFLLQLKRGAGPKGLASMAAVAEFNGNRRLVRPLLGFSKQQIIQYATASAVQWIEDDTNADTSIDRNFLRHDVIPLLRQRWPQFEQVVARAASLCAEQQQLLDELLAAELNSRLYNGALSVAGFDSLSQPHQSALLRSWLAYHRASMPSSQVLAELREQLARDRTDSNLMIRYGNIKLATYRGYLHVVQAADMANDWSTSLNEQIALPADLGTIRVPSELVHEHDQAQCRLLQAGDKFVPPSRKRAVSLSRLLHEFGVPTWHRSNWPVITKQGIILWAAGIGGSAGHHEFNDCRWQEMEAKRFLPQNV